MHSVPLGVFPQGTGNKVLTNNIDNSSQARYVKKRERRTKREKSANKIRKRSTRRKSKEEKEEI